MFRKVVVASEVVATVVQEAAGNEQAAVLPVQRDSAYPVSPAVLAGAVQVTITKPAPIPVCLRLVGAARRATVTVLDDGDKADPAIANTR